MTLQPIKGGLVIPPLPKGFSTTPSFTTTGLTIDAADESVAFIVRAPKTGNIKKVLWGARTVTSTNNPTALDVRIETLNLTATPAVPSGTLWGTTTNGSQNVSDGDDNTSFTTTLTSAAAVTAGDAFAVRINNPNTSFANMQVAGFADDSDGGFPYVLLNTGVSPATSWANVAPGTPMLALEYDDGSYEPVWGAWPIHSTLTATSISTSTTPDSVGTRFQLPFPSRASGCWLWVDADGPFVVKLVSTAYHQVNGTGILAQTPTIENEHRDSAGASIQWLQFTATTDLSANTNYRLVVEGTSGTSLAVYDFDCQTAAALDAFWGGDEWHLTTAKDPTADGSWTNYNSGTFRKFLAGLVLSAFGDDTGGASSMKAPVPMSGGFV